MKTTTLIYCGEDGEAGRALAASLRDGQSHIVLCSAAAFDRLEQPCERVVFASDVPQRLRDRISAAHGMAADVPAMSSLVEAISPKKRGWPKGKPRKKVA